MRITKEHTKGRKDYYQIVIRVENNEDDRSLRVSLDYLISKKDKRFHAAKGKIIMLPKMLREVL